MVMRTKSEDLESLEDNVARLERETHTEHTHTCTGTCTHNINRLPRLKAENKQHGLKSGKMGGTERACILNRWYGFQNDLFPKHFR